MLSKDLNLRVVVSDTNPDVNKIMSQLTRHYGVAEHNIYEACSKQSLGDLKKSLARKWEKNNVPMVLVTNANAKNQGTLPQFLSAISDFAVNAKKALVLISGGGFSDIFKEKDKDISLSQTPNSITFANTHKESMEVDEHGKRVPSERLGKEVVRKNVISKWQSHELVSPEGSSEGSRFKYDDFITYAKGADPKAYALILEYLNKVLNSSPELDLSPSKDRMNQLTT